MEIGANHARSFRNKEQTETEKSGFERWQVTALGKFDSLRPLIRSVFTNYICKNPSDSLFFLSLFALHFNQLSICFSVGRLSSLQAIHPFTHPSTDLQTLHPSISPSKSLDQTPKPSAHSPSHHLHTRTSLPADGVQAQPDVVHSTQVAGGQGNVHSAAVAAAAAVAAVAADRTDAACTG